MAMTLMIILVQSRTPSIAECKILLKTLEIQTVHNHLNYFVCVKTAQNSKVSTIYFEWISE